MPEPTEVPEPKPAAVAPEPPSVLAIPGLNPTRSPRRRAEKPILESTTATPADALPPLVGPSEMPKLRRSTQPPARTSTTVEGPGRSLELETVPRSELTTPRTREAAPSSRAESTKAGPKATSTPTPAPRRAIGLFGRMLPAPFAAPRSATNDSIKVEPRTDPASDAALKRRIEHQIRQSFGDRIRDVEVRVVGREVSVRGRATRFWQRRGLQRSLESIPSLSGLRSTVQVD